MKSKEWEHAQNELDYNRVAHTVTVGVACRLGHVELTRQLLLAGHGVFPDDRRWWPIHEAAYGLHYECCQMLIEIGISLLLTEVLILILFLSYVVIPMLLLEFFDSSTRRKKKIKR